ncbi:MAG: M20/M25/M40 family metallo-hydrolase, partial [Deltaproteobacteria bacterium]|nr:M20/M25/M40 family metallo-hydrolase [Deltaproteobacteria bacterium]
CVIDMARAIEALSLHRFPVRVSPPVEKFIAGIAAIQEFMPETEFLRILDPECSRGVLEKIPDEVLRRMIGVALCNTAVPTVASAGSKTNVIPGECFCEVDCRTLPGSTAQELKNTLAEILASRGCRNFSIELEGDPRPTESSCDTPLYQAIEKAFLRNDPQARVVPYMSPGATDSRFFREIGVPAYGVQFDSSVESAGLIHGHNERIRIEHVTMGVRVLYDAIKEFCVS